MRIIANPDELKAQCRAWRAENQSIALVPTMGYYHAGHESLMAKGRSLGDKLVISLFVNPAQFGPSEDLEAYPRDFERDCEIARRHDADLLFAPQASAMYAEDHATWVETPRLAKGLCGQSRPSHFRGVCTVVLKLLLLTLADYAVFGQKDWQQLAIIRRMAKDLNLDVEITGMPIAREPDGLALSSRNVYLTEAERAQASQIRVGLLLALSLFRQGCLDASEIKAKVLEYWQAKLPLGRVDYLETVEPDSLEPLSQLTRTALLACAVFLGRARLIDNILLEN